MLLIYLNSLDTEEEKTKFEELYNTYKGLMLKIAFDILKDYDMANDALHNAFLKIIKHLHKLDEISCHKTKAYIVLVIESVSKSMYNKRKKEATLSYDELEYEVGDDKNMEDDVVNQITVQYVYERIKSLSDIDQEILTLKYVNNLSDKEIADLLEISNSTVRKRLERAKTRLYSRLNKEMIE